jgi:heme oxygenase
VVDILALEPMLMTVRPEQRAQLAALHADLKWLGASDDELPAHAPVPAAPAHAFGWCYVAERMAVWSTLVTRRLRARLSREIADGGMTFLTGRLIASPLRWTMLGGLLDRGAEAYSAGDIVAGARQSFEAARRWLGSFPTRAQVGAA